MEYDPKTPRAEPFLRQGWMMCRCWCDEHPEIQFWTEWKPDDRTAEVREPAKPYQTKVAVPDEKGKTYDDED